MEKRVLIDLPKGTPYTPEMEKLTSWGGWVDDEEDSGYLEAKIDDFTRRNFVISGYPCTQINWLGRDYVIDGKITERIVFCAPESLRDELFGPKENEWGEVAP